MCLYKYVIIVHLLKINRMSIIATISNMKGGVSKSTTTIIAATALSQEPFKLNICIVDLDRQKSIVKTRNYDVQAYSTDQVPFKVLDYSFADLQKNIAQLDKQFDLIFLDFAGHLDDSQPIEAQQITKALVYVDFLFLPFVSGSHNLDSTLEYYEFIKKVQVIRAVQPRALKVFGFVSMCRPRSKANGFLLQEIEALKISENLKMMQNAINEFSLFRDADTITSLYAPNSSDPAKTNFSIWLNEFLNIIQN